MRMRWVAAVLVVGFVCAGGALTFAQPSAPNDRAICPIADDDLQKATKAFAKIATVFADRRCSNCHGGVNPFSSTGGHVGGAISFGPKMSSLRDDRAALVEALTVDGAAPTPEQVSTAETAIRTWFSAEPPLTDPQTIAELLEAGGLERAMGELCAECHTHTPVHWRTAKSSFVGKTPVQLCEMIQTKMDPSDFLGHVTSDPLNFIQVGFRGTRGLNAFGQSIYEQQTGRTYAMEPVTALTPDAFIAAANDWIDALGARFRKPPSCGCVDKAYGLKVKVDYTLTVAERRGRGDVQSTQTFVAPMRFLKDGAFVAEATVPVKQTLDMQGRGGQCKMEQTHAERWAIEGKVDESAQELTWTATVDIGASTTEVLCVAGGKTFRQSVPGGPPPRQDLKRFDLKMPAFVDEPVTRKLPVSDGELTMTYEVIERSGEGAAPS